MPKRVFWPLAMVVMGLIILASSVGMLPARFWDLWPLILIIVGLGGLVTSDKEEWDGQPKRSNKGGSSTKRTKRSRKK